MKYFIIMLMVASMQVAATGYSNQYAIQQQLKETPQMSERCETNIDYYSGKVTKYELKIHLNLYQKEVLKYYKSELDDWKDYCYNAGEDPDFD